MGDALGSVVVVVAATIFHVLPLEDAPCNWQCYIDPSLTIVMVFIILSSAFPLIKETSTILLQMVPKGVNMKLLSKSDLLLKNAVNFNDIFQCICYFWNVGFGLFALNSSKFSRTVRNSHMPVS